MVGCVFSQLSRFVLSLESLHSYRWKKSRPSASDFSTAKNVELLGLYSIQDQNMLYFLFPAHLMGFRAH